MPYPSKAIKDLCSFSNGHGFTRHDWAKVGLPIIRIGHLNGSRDFDYYPGEPDPEWVVEPGELLFAWAGTKGVSFGPTIWSGPRGVLNQHIFRVRPKTGVDRTWLYYALSQVTRRIEKRAHGFKSTLLHVRKSDVEDQCWPVPPIETQHRVVGILGLAESEVRILDDLIQTKRTLKRGVMQQLLTGQKRFAEFQASSWKSSRLGDHVGAVRRRNTASVGLVLTASGEHGLVDQRRYFNRSVAGADLSRYWLIKKGEFAYNRSAMKGYPYGAAKRLEVHEEGALSTLYLCFAIEDSELDSDFLKHVLDGGVLNRQLRPIVRVGARAHGLLNVSDEDYLSITIPFPQINEQRRIAGMLSALDRELDLLATLRERIASQKCALLSKLLSGDLVVPSS
jgi:type I restriction enzyme, S subunit